MQNLFKLRYRGFLLAYRYWLAFPGNGGYILTLLQITSWGTLKSQNLHSAGYFLLKVLPVTTGWAAEVASNPENKCQHPGLGKVVRLLQGGTQEVSYITQFFMQSRSSRFSPCPLRIRITIILVFGSLTTRTEIEMDDLHTHHIK